MGNRGAAEGPRAAPIGLPEELNTNGKKLGEEMLEEKKWLSPGTSNNQDAMYGKVAHD